MKIFVCKVLILLWAKTGHEEEEKTSKTGHVPCSCPMSHVHVRCPMFNCSCPVSAMGAKSPPTLDNRFRTILSPHLAHWGTKTCLLGDRAKTQANEWAFLIGWSGAPSQACISCYNHAAALVFADRWKCNSETWIFWKDINSVLSLVDKVYRSRFQKYSVGQTDRDL